METTAPSEPARTPPGRVAGLVLGLALIVGVLTVAFAWPSANTGPEEVPIAVIGPPEAAAQAADRLDAAQPGGFVVTVAADPAEAIEMIEHREVYAALALGPEGLDLYTATAASPAVAGLVGGVAEQMAAAMGRAAGQPGAVPVTVEDVVPMPQDDPNGAGLAASALPMAAGGILIGALTATAVRGSSRQAAAAALAPLAVGAAVAGILFGLGSVEGAYWAVTGAIALALLAAAWTVLGLTKLLGRAGTVLGAVTIMLVGNPLSGLTSAPELLPAPLGAVGQHLTPGAGATLLRSVSFFEGHGAQAAAVVLAAWLVGGIALFSRGAVRAETATPAERSPQPAKAAP